MESKRLAECDWNGSGFRAGGLSGLPASLDWNFYLDFNRRWLF